MWISRWHETEESLRSGYRTHVITQDDVWSYPEHRHEGCCEFVVLLHGDLTHRLPSATLEQEAGQVVLLRDGDVHALQGRNFSYVNIMFSSSWLTRLEAYTQMRGLIAQLGSSQMGPAAGIPESERHSYYELVDDLRRYHGHENGRSVFANFLALTVTRYFVPAMTIDLPAGCPDWLGETVAWLHQHHEVVPTLDELVSYACRCKEHVTRQFTHWLGKSPARYLASLRTARAAELLATTNLPVLEICDAVGFQNESYFYRLFRKDRGMSPLAWRRLHGSRSIQKRI